MIDGEEDSQVEIELDDGDLDAEHDAKPEGEATKAAENDDDEDELVAEIEGIDNVEDIDAEKPEDTPLIKRLREANRERSRSEREKDRELADLRAKLAPAKTEVGKKPDRWEDDFDSDEDYDAALVAWTKRKEDADREASDRETAKQAQAENFQRACQAMRTNATKLRGIDFDKAEERVKTDLHPALAELIPLEFGENAPATVVALSQRPEILESINATAKTNFIKAMFQLYDLSKGVKMVSKRKTGAHAEEIVRGSAPLSTSANDKKLDELEKRAARTGDRSEIVAYKAAQKKRAA